MNRFEAKIAVPNGTSVPDTYDGIRRGVPHDDFVISRGPDGKIISRYGDLTWDITNWDSEARRTLLYFDFWDEDALAPHRCLLSRDARWLLFALVWLRNGAPLKCGTILNYMSLIRALALYSDEASCRIPEILSGETLFLRFLEERCSGNLTRKLHGMLSSFSKIESGLLGFDVIGSKSMKVLAARMSDYDAGLKQHPPIPTRIYSLILSYLSKELSEWEEIAPECHALLHECGRNPSYGRREAIQRERAKHGCVTEPRTYWEDIASPKVRAYLRKKGHVDNVVGLGSAVTQVQTVAKLTIHAYSGMRDDECLTLPYDCQEKTVSGGRVHRLIRGRTTKLSKGIKRTRWVTNQEGHRAIAIAREIADAIYKGCGATEKAEKKRKTKKNGYPLFVSIAYLKLGGGRKMKSPEDGHFFPGQLTLNVNTCRKLRARLQPVIDDADVVELEKIDEHRAWRFEDKFQIGTPWVLTSHQLRRSLALYAQRSGLVTLPSLRRQLQHLTDEMARYYSRGSEYAKDIFGESAPEPDHFCLDWQSTQAESEAISYAVHVLTTDETLFGGHVAFVKHHLQGDDGIVSAGTRAETMRMFKKGQLHYRETLIGGCTRNDECDRPAVNWLNVECISNNCSNMVGNLKKLETVIAEQERLVQSIPQTSLLYRTESATLAKLRVARDKARPEKNGASI